jgi:hypothetical protein
MRAHELEEWNRIDWAGGSYLDLSLKMDAPGLSAAAEDLGSGRSPTRDKSKIQVSHVSESRHGAPGLIDVRSNGSYINTVPAPSLWDSVTLL